MLKMGWKGAGLGRAEQGITEPVRGIEDGLRSGLGKREYDEQFTAAENIFRKELQWELQATETDEQRRKREASCRMRLPLCRSPVER